MATLYEVQDRYSEDGSAIVTDSTNNAELPSKTYKPALAGWVTPVLS
jgi:hypothetical protein